MLERTILLAPDSIARRAAALTADPEQAWMLRQPDHVRESYISEVLEAPASA
jgi:hypothetical protein